MDTLPKVTGETVATVNGAVVVVTVVVRFTVVCVAKTVTLACTVVVVPIVVRTRFQGRRAALADSPPRRASAATRLTDEEVRILVYCTIFAGEPGESGACAWALGSKSQKGTETGGDLRASNQW